MEATEGSLGPCDSGARGCQARAAREVRGRARLSHQPKAASSPAASRRAGPNPGPQCDWQRRAGNADGWRETPPHAGPAPARAPAGLQPRSGSRRAPARSPRVSRSLARLWDGGLQPAERADSGRRWSPRASREEARSPKTRTA